MGQTTITVQEETLERFNRLKAELAEEQNGLEQSADMFLQALMDTWDAADNGYYAPEIDEIAEQLVEQLDSNYNGGNGDLVKEIDKLKRLVEKVPEEAADEFASKYA